MATQIEHIEAFIAEGSDLILVEPVTSEGLEPVLGKARSARIPVIAVGNPTSGADAIVGTDNTKAGVLAATLLARSLGGKGAVALVDGTAITANADRMSGFVEVLAEHPELTAVIRLRGALDQLSGEAAARDLLASGKPIDGIFAANDQIALGIAKVLAEQDRPVPIVSVDGVRQAVEQIRAGGPIIGTAAQDPQQLAAVALEVGMALRSGSSRAPHAIFLPPRIIDSTTVDGYEPWG
nr:substrate-binding domain-containing protein [Streptomyces sp. SID5914]